MLELRAFAYNPFQCNCYVLWDTDTLDTIVIDPSFSEEREFSHFDAFIAQRDLKIKAVYNTHLHFDHCLGIAHMQKTYGLEYAADMAGLLFIESAPKQAATYGMKIDAIAPPTIALKERDTFAVGSYTFEVLSAPGHADGSLCFVCHSEKIVITGDVLFRESIGRTDLLTGDLDLLLKNIQEKLFTLPGDYKVYPGHGPATSIAYEQTNNPFLRFGEVH